MTLMIIMDVPNEDAFVYSIDSGADCRRPLPGTFMTSGSDDSCNCYANGNMTGASPLQFTGV